MRAIMAGTRTRGRFFEFLVSMIFSLYFYSRNNQFQQLSLSLSLLFSLSLSLLSPPPK